MKSEFNKKKGLLAKEESVFNKIKRYITLSLVISISIAAIYYDKEKLQRMHQLFNNKAWVSHFLTILLFVMVSFMIEKPKSREIVATKKAALAFTIAVFAYLDFTIAPFWIVWILSYSFDSWI